MSDGTQQFLPFLSQAALINPPDRHFPLAPEQLLLRQRIESIERLIAYQGASPSALQVILGIKDAQICTLEAYIAALEREVVKLCRKLNEPETPEASRRKRPRQTIPALVGPGAMDALPSEPSSD